MRTGILLSALMLLALLGTGCAQQTANDAVIADDAVADTPESLIVTVFDLVKNPDAYVNRTIRTEGVVRSDERMWTYSLADGTATFPVAAWAPTSVASCPPSVKECRPPWSMQNYLGKRVRLTATLQQDPTATSQQGPRTSAYILVAAAKDVILLS